MNYIHFVLKVFQNKYLVPIKTNENRVITKLGFGVAAEVYHKTFIGIFLIKLKKINKSRNLECSYKMRNLKAT